MGKMDSLQAPAEFPISRRAWFFQPLFVGGRKLQAGILTACDNLLLYRTFDAGRLLMNVLIWDDDPQEGVLLGPFSSVEQSGMEIRVPIDVDTMDDEVERFFCEAQLMGVTLDNLLAVQQKGGTWELRELAGKWAYEVFDNAKVVEV